MPDTSRWFPGYTVAAVSALALVATAPGQTMLVSLLNVPLRETFDLSPLVLNASYTAATIAASFPLVWVGRFIDRAGPRRALVRVAMAFGVACGFMAAVPHALLVPVGFFLIRLGGQGALALASHHALAMWFDRRLGAIRGLLTVATFAAWAPLPAITQHAIEAVGWRLTWAAWGLLVAVVVGAVAARFVRDRPEDLGLQVDGREEERDPEASFELREAARTPAFAVLAASSMSSAMIGTAILFDLAPLLALRGETAAAAARVVGLWGVAMAVFALPVGRAVDRFAPAGLLATGAAALGAGCGVLAFTSGLSGVAGGLLALAAGQSLIMATAGAAAARYFGRAHHGAIRSALSRLAVVATGLGPLAFGLSQRATDHFTAALCVFAALCLPVTLAALRLRPPARVA